VILEQFLNIFSTKIILKSHIVEIFGLLDVYT